jgi:probable phosphoglycerate mutase
MVHRSFYFLRHGETDWNVEQRLQGHTDIPLNSNGRRQASEVIQVLRRHPIDRIVCSNLSRAHETAMIVNKILKKPLTVDHDLKERHFGVLEGKTLNDIREFREMKTMDGWPIEENGHPCAPQAETYADFKQRTLGTITRHLTAAAEHNVLFVAHGGLYRVLARAFLGADDHSPNAHPLHFHKDAESWQIKLLD